MWKLFFGMFSCFFSVFKTVFPPRRYPAGPRNPWGSVCHTGGYFPTKVKESESGPESPQICRETFNFERKISMREFIHPVCESSRGEAGWWSVLSLWQGLAVWQELPPSTVPAAYAHSEALKPAEHCESCICLWLALGSALLPNYFSRSYSFMN